MKKKFLHKQVIVKRGNQANSFFILLKGKALVLNSMGNNITNEIFENQSFGLIEILKNIKWKNTIISERSSEVLFIPKDKLLKNIFNDTSQTNLTLSMLKMIN